MPILHQLARLTTALLFAIALGNAQLQADAQLKAGAAAVDITPTTFPINMPGGFSANMAESAHDNFYARAMCLDDGHTAIVMVVVDNLGVAPELIEKAKQIASSKSGLPVSKMLVCSTHTHSGPSSNENSYTDILVDGIAAAIVQSYENRQPASVAAASHPLPDEVFNRRWFLQPGKMRANPFGEMDLVRMNPPRSPGYLDRPAGPTDPDITIISIKNAKRKPLALFANYSLHYVGATPRKQVSADYFGEFARLMPTRLQADDQFVAMMSNGTSGDINNIPFGVTRPPRERFEQVRIVARKAADTAWFAHQSIDQHRSNAAIDMRERIVTLKYRRPTAEQEARARKIVAMTDEDEIAKLPRLAVPYANRTIKAAERKEDTVDIKLQAIRIGDLAVCGIPFETIVEIGLQLKDESPFPQTMVVGLANGRYGYLPTPEQHRLGGYETWLGTNIVQKDASVIIVENLQPMLTELHGVDSTTAEPKNAESENGKK